MRFPDLLVEVNKLGQRVRALELDMNDLYRQLGKVLPEAGQYIDALHTEPQLAPSEEVLNAIPRAPKRREASPTP